MRARFLFVVSVVPVAAQDYWCLNHHFHLFADYSYSRRQDVRNLTLVQQGDRSGSSQTVIDNNDLEKRLQWESAIRGGILYNATACNSWEVMYTYFYPWTATVNATGDDNLFFPFKDAAFGDDYQDAFRAEVHYKTRLQSGECNYWGHLTPQRVNYFSFSWNAGARFIDLREKLRMLFFREEDISPYDIKTWNALYGAQIGAMLQINPSCWWTWTFLIKGAGFLNDACNELKIRDQNDQITIGHYKKSRWTDSWLLEGSGALAFHVDSWLSVRLCYQGYILTGVVLAPNQRDTSQALRRRIHTKGQIVIDGLYAGLDCSF